MMTQPDAKVVLASASPRRLALLKLLGLDPMVRPADIDETRRPGEEPKLFAQRLAEEKCAEIATRLELPILAADTVVAIGDRTLGKPAGADDAAAMLRSLSGTTHEVHTGVAVASRGRTASLVDTTEVRFRKLDDDAINWYLHTGESMGKAGAYAVQGAGGLLIESVNGSPQTVVGLPIHLLPNLFNDVGVDLWELMASGTDLSGR